MSITDELRKAADDIASTAVPCGASPDYIGVRRKIDAIADRIDEQHAKARDKAYSEGVNDGIDADKNAMGYVKLPVDADGVPIRIGDTMEWLDGSTAEVIGIGDGVFFYKDDESDGADWSSAEGKRHYHAPTVEDVLREFAQCWDDPVHYAKGELVEQYAAKLRLAGEAE